ncbi:MAG: uridine kinase [Pedosphaera sp.]|nr:uridine kinase [Pedosphaera sp.]
MKSNATPFLIAIVGGSGAGKSWLADRLQAKLGATAGRLSLDDFYHDRSHLPPGRRARINVDHPRAIDWERLEAVLRDCLAGRSTRVPRYDFKTHTRLPAAQVFRPKRLIIVDGLWLLWRPGLRRLFGLRIFIDCPAKVRLNRRLARDLLLRGRDQASVHRQFRETVEPMNAQYVVPQARWAHIILKAPISPTEVSQLVRQLRTEKGQIENGDGSLAPNGNI